MPRLLQIALALPLVWSAACAPLALSSRTAGLVYNNSEVPLLLSASEAGPARGIACAYSILGLFTFGDASANAAARSAGIDTIATVDQRNFSVLGVYGSMCTLVSGTGKLASTADLESKRADSGVRSQVF